MRPAATAVFYFTAVQISFGLPADCRQRFPCLAEMATLVTRMNTISAAEAFSILDMRIGRILRAEPHPRARKPSYQLAIDFGAELGIRNSSAQITEHYTTGDLVGRLVVCAVNLGSRNIAGFVSEVLTLGVADANGHVVLLQPDAAVTPGTRVY